MPEVAGVRYINPDQPLPSPAPFLRWAGGKRRLLPVLSAGSPSYSGRYFEPFAGSAAKFFADAPTRAVLGDTNTELMVTYEQLTSNVTGVCDELEKIASGFNEEKFYQLRATVPSTDVARAARFIAYNRTCFNGLFRMNASGGWNTPYGHLKNPTICDGPLLHAVSKQLQKATLRRGPYGACTVDAQRDDFTYFDPPYVPKSATSSFTAYTADGFGLDDQRDLAAHMAALIETGVHVMLSNSDTPVSREIFTGIGLTLYSVNVRRSISASGAAREVVSELLAVSYPLSVMSNKDTFLSHATALT